MLTADFLLRLIPNAPGQLNQLTEQQSSLSWRLKCCTMTLTPKVITMRRLARWLAIFLGSLLFCSIVGLAAFEVLVVQPALSKIESFIAAAAPSERKPPAVVVEMLRRTYRSHLTYLVASRALYESPSQVEGAGTLHRQFTELGVGLLLPLHLSGPEIAAAFMSKAYMGPGVFGFAEASDRYMGVPLENLSVEQAAELVAIAHSPSAYLGNPQRLERRTQYLLSLQPR
jgi:hypothetical protein